MAYNQHLAERIALALKRKKISFIEKKMFGGLCFMVDDKMCVGVMKEKLMARINPAEAENLLQKEGATLMDFSGKSMHGFLFVNDDGWDADADLDFWVEKCIEYNPLAKSSKK